MREYYTMQTSFFGDTNPEVLLNEYGSPLFVYNENIFRTRCMEMANLVAYSKFKVTYSVKANSNLELLKIAHEEGLHADAMSPGEIYILMLAGFEPDEIFYISNNVSEEEMRYAIERGILVSVDSLSQLEQYGRINQGGEVAVRFNPGIGAGHHHKVITGGKETKFGINIDKADDVKSILEKYNLRLAGINQHIGSLFMEGDSYLEGVSSVLDIASDFEDLDFIDFGGGFGIPYRKQEGEKRLDLTLLGKKLDDLLSDWTGKYGKEITFRIEPGRYISAESCVLLGRAHSIKDNYDTRYIGTDLGFNVLTRPVMYDSHHDIEVYRKGRPLTFDKTEIVTVVGNICETGDIIAAKRELPEIVEGDIIGVMDAGAYGYSMSSNYNCRLRPAEVIVDNDGSVRLIRRRDTLDDLIKGFNIQEYSY